MAFTDLHEEIQNTFEMLQGQTADVFRASGAAYGAGYFICRAPMTEEQRRDNAWKAKAWRRENRERYNASIRAWRCANPERLAVMRKRYYEANKAVIMRKSSEYKKKRSAAARKEKIEGAKSAWAKKKSSILSSKG